MTRYAFDEARNALVATWSYGRGDVATTVAELPKALPAEQALRLAETLTVLSRAAWRTYTHPASAADSHEPNSEGWRRDQERQAFAHVSSAVRTPNLPEHGMPVQSYIWVEESAHQVGRALHEIADQHLLDRVVADVGAELAAIESAERGELSGRARQAVQLTREDASPVQVAAADALLAEEPLGCGRLFSEVDPTAASVAAAHWLLAAADVTAEVAGIDPTVVVAEADNIEALAVRTPSLVLDLLNEGDSPREIVTSLISDAMAAAEGRIPDIDGLLDQVMDAEQQAGQYGDHADEIRQALMPDRVTTLDPSRPAQELLEDLLDGIRGCWLLHREYADRPEIGECDEADEEQYQRWEAEHRVVFANAVRAEAATKHHRLV